MPKINIEIAKREVYEEVAKTTDYTGSKMLSEEASSREKIFASEAELEDMERFWETSKSAIRERYKELLEIKENDESSDYYRETFEVSKSFDERLKGLFESILKDFLISSITGQWMRITYPECSESYISEASSLLDSGERILYSRKKPKIPK